ncbi:hypothetical protein ACFXKW_20825 [Streptomyces sp. NPDC059193]|uniref:hypothetical protein n=1 Tax=Streptomyces sp. NPDC059193 TaxID=3346763 RepID=UPI0036C8D2F0
MTTAPRDTSQPGRIYMAVITTHGAYANSQAYWLGRPCATCAENGTDPKTRHTIPCRAPLTHAHAALRRWRTNPHPERYILLTPYAKTLGEARRTAARMCPILMRPARRTTEQLG